ncbi:MAG: GntR family transcriptional regulator [Caulobacterales bacterium]|nr:GntR family transcriptional regulator [Caulobacterales bacterium]
MTRMRDPFLQALDSLRRLSEQGVFAPGTPIVIVEEARRLRLSTTPVREALAWLCGEGLIERAPSGGYLAPRMDAALVRDRFAFRLHCLTTSLDLIAAVHDRDEPVASTAAPESRLAESLDRMVRGTGNQVLAEAFDRVGRQLRPLEAAERRIFRDREAEAAAILRVSGAGAIPALRQALVAYHQRRMDAAPLLVLDVAGERRDPADRDG